MGIEIEIARGQVLLSAALIEYDAPWLENKGKVVRDKGGRFASKVAPVTSDLTAPIQAAMSSINEVRDKMIDTIESLPKQEQVKFELRWEKVQDPWFEKGKIRETIGKLRKDIRDLPEDRQIAIERAIKRARKLEKGKGDLLDKLYWDNLRDRMEMMEYEEKTKPARDALYFLATGAGLAVGGPLAALQVYLGSRMFEMGWAGTIPPTMSIPNLLQIGWVWDGAEAALRKESPEEIQNAFKTGATEQLTFDIGLLFAAGGIAYMANVLKEIPEFEIVLKEDGYPED